MSPEVARLQAEVAPYRAALERLEVAGRGQTPAGIKVRESVAYYDLRIAKLDRSPGWVARARKAGISARMGVVS